MRGVNTYRSRFADVCRVPVALTSVRGGCGRGRCPGYPHSRIRVRVRVRGGAVGARIDGQIFGVGEDQSPVVERDRPPMHWRPLMPTAAGIGRCRVVLDDFTGDVGLGASANQDPQSDRQLRTTYRPVATVSGGMLMHLFARRTLGRAYSPTGPVRGPDLHEHRPHTPRRRSGCPRGTVGGTQILHH